MSHKDAVHNDPFVCLIRLRLNPDKKVVMRRPASLLSVEKNGGRGKRRARSECEFYFYFFSKSDQPVFNHSHARSECEFSYQIIVADAADAVSVNFSGRCKFLQI